MKISAKIINKHQNKLLLECLGYVDSEKLKELDATKQYVVEFREVKSNRSLEQNKLLWKIIDDLAAFQCMNSVDIYCEVLEMANVSYEYICALPIAEKQLQQAFRAIKFIKEVDINGKVGNMYKCFYGSSKMNVKEMNDLIATAISYGYELGMDMSVYER